MMTSKMREFVLKMRSNLITMRSIESNMRMVVFILIAT